jgi:hypothetical protein
MWHRRAEVQGYVYPCRVAERNTSPSDQEGPGHGVDRQKQAEVTYEFVCLWHEAPDARFACGTLDRLVSGAQGMYHIDLNHRDYCFEKTDSGIMSVVAKEIIRFVMDQ